MSKKGCISIRYATNADLTAICKTDKHISPNLLEKSINEQKVLTICVNGNIAGFLRYNLFWDNTPFMNMLYVLEGFRLNGYGKELTEYWEREMAALGYSIIMTSTQENETAQFFYRKIGYEKCGDFTLPNESKELIFCKILKS